MTETYSPPGLKLAPGASAAASMYMSAPPGPAPGPWADVGAAAVAPRASRMPQPYLIAWGLLASLALGYLALLAVRPDLAESLILRPANGAPEGNAGQRSMSKILAELGNMKTAVAKLEGEAKDFRTALQDQEQRALTLEARLALVETATKGGPTPVAHAGPALQTSAAHSDGANHSAPVPGALAGPTTQGTVEERATKALRDGRAAPSRPAAATASAAGIAVSKPVEPSGPPVGVLIASGPSLDAVRLSWQLLIESNKSALRSLEPRFVERGVEPTIYQLIAGPVATREEAAKVCDRLRAKQVRCTVTTFAGNPL